jgi:hypothetical protein
VTGVGTALKDILEPFGDTKRCPNCAEKVKLLDEKGPEWAEENIDTVVRWLVDNSKRLFVSRLIPEFLKTAAARSLVQDAIAVAKQQNQN